MYPVHEKLKVKTSTASAPNLIPSRRRSGDEQQQWFDSLEFVLEYLLKKQDSNQAESFVENLVNRLRDAGVDVPHVASAI